MVPDYAGVNKLAVGGVGVRDASVSKGQKRKEMQQNFCRPTAAIQPLLPKTVVIRDPGNHSYHRCMPDNEVVDPTAILVMVNK